jgi:hypothetical protein
MPISGAAYDYASPAYTSSLAIGNVRVGASTNKSVTNTTITNASFQDGLDVTATNGGNSKITVTNPGKIAAGTSGNIVYTANTAGSLATTSSLGLVSDANGVAGLSNSSLTGGSIAITGVAYDYASPALNTAGPVDFGYVHQGGTATGNVSISNTVISNASFQDSLDASVTTDNGEVAGNSTHITAGNSGSLTLTGNTSVAGSLASTVTLGYTSNANGVSGVSNTALSSGSISTTGQVYSGHGIWSGTGASGSWGTLAVGFGTKWGAFQGSPGLDPGFTGVDTATFNNVTNHSAVAVNLDGASPNLNSVTFNGSTTSYNLTQGSGGAGRQHQRQRFLGRAAERERGCLRHRLVEQHRRRHDDPLERQHLLGRHDGRGG